METWNARSTEDTGVNRGHAVTLSERLSGGKRTGVRSGAFSDAFGDIVMRMTRDIILNASTVVKSIDADLSQAADVRFLPDPYKTKSSSNHEDDAPFLPNPEETVSASRHEEDDYEAVQPASTGPVFMDSESRETARSGSKESVGTRPAASAKGNLGSAASQETLGKIVADSELPAEGGAPKDQLMRDGKGGFESAFRNEATVPNALSPGAWQAIVQSNLALAPGSIILADTALLPGGQSAAQNFANAALPGTPAAGELTQMLPTQVAPQAPAYSTAFGYEDLSDRIIQGVRIAQHAESTEVFVRLKPDFLGRLSIRVLSDEHGMRIDIKAENQLVRQVMQENLADLQQRLAEKGLAFNQFNILADAGSRSWQESQWTEPSIFDPESEPAVGTVEAPLLLTRSGIIDYFA